MSCSEEVCCRWVVGVGPRGAMTICQEWWSWAGLWAGLGWAGLCSCLFPDRVSAPIAPPQLHTLPADTAVCLVSHRCEHFPSDCRGISRPSKSEPILVWFSIVSSPEHDLLGIGVHFLHAAPCSPLIPLISPQSHRQYYILVTRYL